MIRILDGITFRIMEMNKLENAVTAVKAKHITTVTCMELVTAKAEQIPKICSAIGLLSKIGPITVSLKRLMLSLPSL
jgi:hypothetical protein